MASLDNLALLGSHNSCARLGGPLVQTQTLSIKKQLAKGVRVLDLRLNHSRDELLLFHGPVDQRKNFRQVLQVVCRFLVENPNEFVLVRIKKEGVPLLPHRFPFDEQVLGDLTVECGARFFECTTVPTVSQAQGRIIVLQNFEGVSVGIPWTDCCVQDDFWVLSCTVSPLRAKLNAAIAHAKKAAESTDKTLFVNFLSATGGCTPFQMSRFIKPAFFKKFKILPVGITMCDFV